MRKLRQHRVAIGIALLAILLAALMPAIAQWRAAMQQDPFAVYCTVQGTQTAQTALGTKTTPRADAQRQPTHDGHTGHDDAQAPPAQAQPAGLHSSHGGADHSLASEDHWEKCGYCALWAHQPLVTTDFHTPPPAAQTGIAAAPRAPVSHDPRARFSDALARAPPSLAV
ncbi:hypothetical protein PCA20602_03028 [Pandoraea capi]|uniref:DUF2946 domain-containing protein n=1 Tax=Pandoraea capi TaxID=2508286 RepID=A0ABY6W2W4_9BURK|nr:DUF2946 family protein [Pandoraea capi]VVE18762.1 hypothetical protein PCA20602_03028 [Pandoraea capi]